MEEEIVYEFTKKIVSNRQKDEPRLRLADNLDKNPLKYVKVVNQNNFEIGSTRHKIVGPYIVEQQGKL